MSVVRTSAAGRWRRPGRRSRVGVLLVAALMALGFPVVAAGTAQAAVSTGGLHVDAPATRFYLGADEKRKVLFEGVSGMTVTVSTSPGSPAWSPCQVKVTVLDTAGLPLTQSVCAGQGATLNPLQLQSSGSFAVLLEAVGAPWGEGRVRVTSAPTGPRSLTPMAGPLSLTLPPGETMEYGFRLQRGEFAYSVFSPYPQTTGLRTSLVAPDGQVLARDWGARLDHAEAPVTGVYRLRLLNPGTVPHATQLTVEKGRDVVVQDSASGNEFNLTRKGQRGILEFEAKAGQRVTVDGFLQLANNPNNVRKLLVGGIVEAGAIWDPAKGVLLQDDSSSSTFVGTVKSTGTHRFLLDPGTWLTGQVSAYLRVYDAPGTRPLPADYFQVAMLADEVTTYTVALRRGQQVVLEGYDSSSFDIDFRSLDGVAGVVEKSYDRLTATRTGVWNIQLRAGCQRPDLPCPGGVFRLGMRPTLSGVGVPMGEARRIQKNCEGSCPFVEDRWLIEQPLPAGKTVRWRIHWPAGWDFPPPPRPGDPVGTVNSPWRLTLRSESGQVVKFDLTDLKDQTKVFQVPGDKGSFWSFDLNRMSDSTRFDGSILFTLE